MNVIKRLIEAFTTARDFELTMKMMDSMRSKKAKYRIMATREQMNMLRLFASYGCTVNDFERGFRFLPRNIQDDIAGD